MEWVVTTGRTLEEAKEAALDELGVDERDAEFEVLEAPRPGLFGRQRGEARVRAWVRPTVPRPKLERRWRRRAARGGAGSEARAGSEERTGSRTDGPRGVERKTAPSGVVATWESEESRESRGDSDGPIDDREDDVEHDTEGLSPEALRHQVDLAREFMRGLLARFGVTASVETTPPGADTEAIQVRVSGEQLGLLIGPKGQTLAALQELTRTAVQRHSEGRVARLVLDVDGYRERRRMALERFAHQVAQDVAVSGVERALEPMSAPDRKVVHDTVNAFPGVRTVSEGQEPNRRVIIQPVLTDFPAGSADSGSTPA